MNDEENVAQDRYFRKCGYWDQSPIQKRKPSRLQKKALKAKTSRKENNNVDHR